MGVFGSALLTSAFLAIVTYIFTLEASKAGNESFNILAWNKQIKVLLLLPYSSWSPTLPLSNTITAIIIAAATTLWLVPYPSTR